MEVGGVVHFVRVWVGFGRPFGKETETTGGSSETRNTPN